MFSTPGHFERFPDFGVNGTRVFDHTAYLLSRQNAQFETMTEPWNPHTSLKPYRTAVENRGSLQISIILSSIRRETLRAGCRRKPCSSGSKVVTTQDPTSGNCLCQRVPRTLFCKAFTRRNRGRRGVRAVRCSSAQLLRDATHSTDQRSGQSVWPLLRSSREPGFFVMTQLIASWLPRHIADCYKPEPHRLNYLHGLG